jgi:hypothetical protein
MKKVSTLAPQGAERRFERKLKQQPTRVRKPQYKVSKYPQAFAGAIQMAQDPTAWFNKMVHSHRIANYILRYITFVVQGSRLPKNDPAIVAINTTIDTFHRESCAILRDETLTITPVTGASELKYVEPPPVDVLSFGTKEILAKYQID